jgi:lipid-binding SYLF domain-containing protein
MRNISINASILALALSIGTIGVSAQDKEARERRDVAKTAGMATVALNELMGIPASAIPDSLLTKAKAIAVFPNVVKAAFVIGGSGGKGLISRRTDEGWSAPAVFKIGGGSIGFQIGASSNDIVMLFMSDDGLDSLLANRFEIGGEASVAAGPVGRTAKATTDAQMRAKILSYSRSRGVFAGVSLAGAVISPDDDANRAVYGLKAKELMGEKRIVGVDSVPVETKGFVQAVTKHSK